MTAKSETLKKILQYAIDKKASDIHIGAWEPLIYRIKKHITSMWEASIISDNQAKIILLNLMNHNEERAREFLKTRDADFAYIFEDGTSFRVNAFFKLWKISFVLRRIESDVIPMDKLGLPEWVNKFVNAKQWLVLVTGPTGSGKSTSMIAILNEINEQRGEHILTIEDPVEFVFKNKKSIFSQREVWNDTKSFTSALRAAMREDPDVIVIWEMRDKETVEAAMELAETGHLVISTMHTSWSVQTITRLINFFPSDVQNAVKYKLWDILVWVLSQRLIQKADGSWIVWIYEIMHMTTGIKSLIREWNLNQVAQNIEMWSKDWMILMKRFAENLEEKWIINKEAYITFFQDEF